MRSENRKTTHQKQQILFTTFRASLDSLSSQFYHCGEFSAAKCQSREDLLPSAEFTFPIGMRPIRPASSLAPGALQ